MVMLSRKYKLEKKIIHIHEGPLWSLHDSVNMNEELKVHSQAFALTANWLTNLEFARFFTQITDVRTLWQDDL